MAGVLATLLYRTFHQLYILDIHCTLYHCSILVQEKQIDDVDNQSSGRIGASRAPAFAGTDC